jgi:bla regulator protein blaR1
VANHLWQSTLFAAAAGLLALALRNNHARARYWLWLIASVKFLIPFSLLVAMGSHFGPSTAPASSSSGLSIAMEQISRPFNAPAVSLPAARMAVPAAESPIPVVMLGIWACGFVTVAFFWWVRWRRIHAAVRAASPLVLGADVPVLSSPALLEPGIFGIFRPVLLLPEGITDRLAPEHVKAILAHELCHVRRRDNLTAAIHMAVEAIFWFHPLTWWLGVRLVEERERACDEEVLQLGNEPQVYAESILKTCQFYLESPLTCMSGVTGSDLKKRVIRIMTQHAAHRLDFGRKLLLAAAGMGAVAAPIVFGLIDAPQSRAQSQPASGAPLPSFEVASIKPNKSGDRGMFFQIPHGGRFRAVNVGVKMLIGYAYNIRDFQISGGPGWLNSEKYDIEAKTEGAASDDPMKLSEEQRKHQEDQLRLMVQSLLADRFKLTIRQETKELPVYALAIAKNGPKLQAAKEIPASPAPSTPQGPKGAPLKGRGMMMRPGQLTGQSAPVSFLAQALSQQLGRTVIDKTGLAGIYDFTLEWAPDERQPQMFKGAGDGEPGRAPTESAPPPDSSGPSIFTAVQEQLGLKLESQKGPVEILVIDQVDRPTEN